MASNNNQRGLSTMTPLQLAAAKGHLQAVKMLIDRGSKLDATDEDEVDCKAEDWDQRIKKFQRKFVSMTPLQLAAAEGHLQCVRFLIDCGSNLDATDEVGYTAVHLAAKYNRFKCLRMLLEAGADYSVPVRWPWQDDVTTMARRIYVGTTALHLAATCEDTKCIEELMRCGADCDAVDEKGHTSLYIAAKAGSERCVLSLLRNIRGVTCVSLPSFDTSDTPLHHAVSRRMVEGVKELVRLGADVNHRNHKGLSPLHLLFVTRPFETHRSDIEILKCLILEGHNTNINERTMDGRTALDHAILIGRNAVILQFLLAHGAEADFCLSLKLELKSPTSVDNLECLVNYMPQLPHLESLDVFSASNILRELHSILSEEELKYVLGGSPMVIDQEVDDMEVLLECIIGNQPNPLHQPYLDKIYELVCQKLPHKDNSTSGEVHHTFVPPVPDSSLLILKKKLWYQRFVSNPLTLKHLCRYSVRKYMGPSRLKHISKLPVPERIKLYLFHKGNE